MKTIRQRIVEELRVKFALEDLLSEPVLVRAVAAPPRMTFSPSARFLFAGSKRPQMPTLAHSAAFHVTHDRRYWGGDHG
jgi:hypothetical protein